MYSRCCARPHGACATVYGTVGLSGGVPAVCPVRFRGGGAQALIGPSHSVHGHGEARSRSSAPRACTGFYSAADTLAACAASSGGPEVGRETIPEPIAGPPPGRNGAEVAAKWAAAAAPWAMSG